MRYLSVCSGIEAASVAWHPLGWEPAGFSEIDPFARAVLGERWPGVPLHGDFTELRGDEHGPVDVLVGGTPCQDFSVAGLRAGLAGLRGNLTLQFLRLAGRLRPAWIVWENVPGVLSLHKGRAFGAVLGGLAQIGYGFAYRILDAQYFGLAQRRERVFVVGHLGDWRRAAAVLFERESLHGHPAPRREKGQRVADRLAVGANQCSGTRSDFVEATLIVPDVTATLAGVGDKQRPPGTSVDGASYMIVMAHGQANAEIAIDQSPTLTLLHEAPILAHFEHGELHPPLRTVNPQQILRQAMQVRRLTPRECERLQGFPDDYTLIPWRKGMAPDGPRYKALGNSMAVPVMRWIGQRIQMIEKETNR